MDLDDIINLAHKAEGEAVQHGFWMMHIEDLERFAALVAEHMKQDGWRQCAVGQGTTQFCSMVEQAVQAEREACAKVCEQHWDDNGQHCANAIRSRG